MKFILFLSSLLLLLATVVYQFLIPEKVNELWFSSVTVFLIYLWYPIKVRLASIKIDIPLLMILILAAILRTANLTTHPFQVHGDEAEMGLAALSILHGTYPNLVGVGWYDLPLLSFIFPIPSFFLFGANLFSLRLTSVVLGLVSIYILYILIKLLTENRMLALSSAFILAVSSLHIHYSRTGYHYMQAVVFVLLTFYFFWRAIIKRDLNFFTYSGFATGLSLQVYYAARITLLILSIFVLTKIIMHHRIKTYWMAFKYFIFGLLFSFLPMFIFFLQNKETFFSRTQQVLIFNNIDHLSTVYGTSDIMLIIYNQIVRTLSFFFGGADATLQYGYRFGGFDIITSSFFFAGLILLITLRLLKNVDFFFMVIWVMAMFVSVILTIDVPSSPRILPILPVVSFIAAYCMYTLFHYLRKHRLRYVPYIFIVLTLTTITILNVRMYFVIYSKTQPINEHTKIAYRLLVLEKEKSGRFYCLVNSSVPFDYPTIRFLAPTVRGVTIQGENADHTQCQVIDGSTVN